MAFHKPKWQITLVWRHDAHPVYFRFTNESEYNAKWAEVSAEMQMTNKNPKYTYACGGGLTYGEDVEHPHRSKFYNHSQITRGFNTSPRLTK